VVGVVRFDRDGVRESLSVLAPWQRVGFAAGCVEVLLPAYLRFSELEEVGDPVLVRAAMDAVWSGLESADRSVPDGDLPSPDSIRALLPAEDDWNEWAPQAEDAVAALVYLLQLVRDDDVELAVYAAERAYAAADEFEARSQELAVLDAQDRQMLSESPSVQTELRRQVESLAALRNPQVGPAEIARLRADALRKPVGGDVDTAY
jgi:uncharacterized protein YjaG (DUF416 family)